MSKFKEFDSVYSTVDKPEESITKDMAGTIVDVLAPSTFIVEFFDNEGDVVSIVLTYEHEIAPRK